MVPSVATLQGPEDHLLGGPSRGRFGVRSHPPGARPARHRDPAARSPDLSRPPRAARLSQAACFYPDGVGRGFTGVRPICRGFGATPGPRNPLKTRAVTNLSDLSTPFGVCCLESARSPLIPARRPLHPDSSMPSLKVGQVGQVGPGL